MILTPEQIANFPVAHLSPSAINCYLNDRQMFFRQYIRFEYDNTVGPSLIEGTAVHYALEQYYTDIQNEVETKHPEEYIAMALDKLRECCDLENVQWGKTGNIEDSSRKVKSCLKAYFNEMSPLKPLGIEQKIVASFDELPIPIKAVSDLVCVENGELVIIDHKTVSSFSDDGQLPPKYIIQAVCNYWTVWHAYGRKPVCMYFDEIKKSENRDGSPQIKRITVYFDDDTVLIVKAIYDRILKELSGQPLIDNNGVMLFLPNPSAAFGALDSWNDFVAEVTNGTEYSAEAVRMRKNSPENVEVEGIDL